MTIDEALEIKARLDALVVEFSKLTQIVIRIEANQQSEAQRCMYREKIETSFQAAQQQVKLEDRLRNVEMKVAMIGGIAGIVTSIITAMIMQAIGG